MLDLFAGVGGFSYAAENLVTGFKTTQFVEWDKKCQQVLAKHWPNVPIHSDIKDFHGRPKQFDVLAGGFPCQDISVAGKQLGLKGERSSMFYEVMRLLGEIRPNFLLLENVGNLLSHGDGKTFQEVLFQIAKAGYNAEWSAIPASDVGACHLRVRTWIIAYSYHSRLEGRIIKELSECSSQQPAWTKSTPYLQPDWRRFVSEPVLRRGDDGLSNRVDRLKQLGNAVVPQVAAVPLERIKYIANILKAYDNEQ